jgi:putative ABC transport system ATP-binding protein
MPESPVIRPKLARAPAGDVPVLALKGVTKVFLTEEFETHALSDVHLEVAQGEFLAIAGPSGSGKSTLLSILGLLDTPTSGSYCLAGREVAGISVSDRAELRASEIGFIFQSFNLILDLDVEENVMLPLSYRGMSKTERRRRAGEALERVGMSHRARHMPGQLSGGQQQRVAVARAVAGSPKILFADEPTGNLDSRAGAEILTFMEKAVDDLGQTIVMVTHDPVAAAYADRVVFLVDGRIVTEMQDPSAERVLDQMKALGDA